MSLGPESVPRQNLGSLQSCLVEGGPEQRARERSVHRDALLISIVLQTVTLALFVLIPLFAKPEHLLGVVLPPAPYYSPGGPRRAPRPQPLRSRPLPNTCRFCAPLRIPRTIPTIDDSNPRVTDSPVLGTGPAVPGQVPIVVATPNVRPPVAPVAEKSRVVHFTHLDPAMLIHRVEPVYPTLARQLARAGRVELRAVIATDGSIQSLKVVSGDPLFYQSAMDAVRQWRYRPTVLNGEAVEIDTFITVIYNSDR